MNRLVEDRLGAIGACGGAAVAALVARYRGIYLEQSAASLFGAAINVGAIAAGFLATCQSILLSSSDNVAISNMRRTDHFGRLLRFIANSVRCSFALAVFSTVLITLNFARKDALHTGFVVAWSAVAGMTALSYYRSVGILLYLLQSHHSATVKTVRPEADILPD